LLVQATIETIEELSLAQASFARIAEQAGPSSTRLSRTTSPVSALLIGSGIA
jgi:hypothetical protein